jgi:hypothetical protein
VSAQTEVLVVKVLVDDTHHTHLAVATLLLSAVVPDRLGVLHNNLENVGSLALSCGKVEAGKETCTVGERLTGLAEAGLGDGVVGGEEVPLDYVADLSDDIVGIEAKTTETGVDRMSYACESDGLVWGGADCLRGGCCGDSGSEEQRNRKDLGQHFDVVVVYFRKKM